MSKESTQTNVVKIMRLYVLPLATVALAIALLLAATYSLTKEKIAHQQHESERRLLDQLLPASLHDNELLAASFELNPHDDNYQQLHLLGLDTTRKGYLGTMKGSATGVILPLETEGYNGRIVLLAGIAADGSITGVRALQHAETAGLGDKIDSQISPWISSFDQHSLADIAEPQWQVKKDGGSFDQFVGATITPRAVVNAVHNALLFFDANCTQLLRGKP